MEKFSFQVKGGASPEGKSRIYFTCHPDDFDLYFEKIKTDIFSTHDCAIYFTKDMTAELDEADLDIMNLFVVPVTLKLLTESNRAMDSDIAYAKEKGIPVLPFMMQPNIDKYYANPSKFGALQYLNPYSADLTEIRYEDKLKKYLENVLISDQMAKRIREAFDAYIFLSYRKKDRKYANELMRMIHKNPELWNIAIWYDEFLVPGESFSDSIQEALEKSDLFALLVTPNLLEEPNGKPNFVMEKEYPKAANLKKQIFPAEMVQTDREALTSKFTDIPECVSTQNEEFFREQLLHFTQSMVLTQSTQENPEHTFLVGLAYLEGIDVEVNRERGLDLITEAAEADLPEAIKKLYHMYFNGVAVKMDYQKAAKWAEKLIAYYTKQYGEKDMDAIFAMHAAGCAYLELHDYENAGKWLEKAYRFMREEGMDETNPALLNIMNSLSTVYEGTQQFEKSLEWSERAYRIYEGTFWEESDFVLRLGSNLAAKFSSCGRYQEALALAQKIYAHLKDKKGTEHLDTLDILNNLAVIYDQLGMYDEALQASKQVYEQYSKILGEKHPHTLTALSNLAITYGNMPEPDYFKTLCMHQEVCNGRKEVLGEKHPDTLNSLNELARNFNSLNKTEQAMDMAKKAYTLFCETLGEDHEDTINALHTIGLILNCNTEALSIEKTVYQKYCKIFGEQHPEAIASLKNLAIMYCNMDQYGKAAELMERVYTQQSRVLGEEHPKTLNTLDTLCKIFGMADMYREAIPFLVKSLKWKCKNLGEVDRDTLNTAYNLSCAHAACGKFKMAISMLETLHIVEWKNYGSTEPDTLRALSTLVDVNRMLTQKTKYAERKEKIYTLTKKFLREENPRMISMLENLAEAYTDCENYQKAEDAYQNLLALYVRISDKNHPKIPEIKQMIEEIHKKAAELPPEEE